MSTNSSKVKRTLATFKAAAGIRRRTDAFIDPENLSEYWLEQLGIFYQFWRSVTQRVASRRVDGSPQVLLAAFVEEFLKAASFAVTCAPWRSACTSKALSHFPLARRSLRQTLWVMIPFRIRQPTEVICKDLWSKRVHKQLFMGPRRHSGSDLPGLSNSRHDLSAERPGRAAKRC